MPFPSPGDLLCFLNWKVGSLPLAPLGKHSFLNHHHNFRQNECLLLSSTMEGFGNISESRSVMSDSLQPHGLFSPWTSPGQNIGVGSCSLLQGIFPTQGSNQGLLHCRQIFYHLNQWGILQARILEWVAWRIPTDRGAWRTRVHGVTKSQT